MAPIRWGGPSATRIRTAAKRALSGPLVPRLQLSDRQEALASVFSPRARDVWHGVLTWLPTAGDGEDQGYVLEIDLLARTDPTVHLIPNLIDHD